MSRLEEMKNNIEILTLEERLWLIDQAERVDMLIHENMEIRKGYQERSKRVQELEREIEGREKFELGTTDNLKILREQNKRYREALEQIKKEETVTTALPEGQKAYTASGHIARKALESESDD